MTGKYNGQIKSEYLKNYKRVKDMITKLDSLKFQQRYDTYNIYIMEHFVYIHKNPVNGEVFYVGQGSKHRGREERAHSKDLVVSGGIIM